MKATHFTLAAAALFLAACAPGATMDAAGASPAPDLRTSSSVSVDNRNWMDMVVYLVQGSSRLRLGTVTAMSSARFRMPRSAERYPGQLRLMADPIGSSRAYVSDAVLVRPGQQLALQLGTNLAGSFVSVRN